MVTILMEELVDIVVHLTMEEEGTRVSLDMEEVEVDTSLHLKLHDMVTAAVATGIGSCSTSNVNKHTEGATANLSLLPTVLLVLVRTETLKHLMEGTTLDTEGATAPHPDLMVPVRTETLDHPMEDTTLDTAWGFKPVPLSRLQVHQLIALLSSLARVLPPLTRQRRIPLPGQHRVLQTSQQSTILPTLMVLTEAMDLTEELPVTEDHLVMADTEATVEVMDLTEEE